MPKMIALRRFRMASGQTLSWINKGQRYDVPADQKDFHIKTGRGKPVEVKQSSKKGN